MKHKLLLSSLLAILLHIKSFSQCPEGNVILIGQSEVDNFGLTYPNCDAIEGFLIIQGSNVTNLSPLSQLNSVGSLLINETSLTNVQNLNNITITGLAGVEDAFIVIDDNPLLQNLSFLSNYKFNEPIVFLIRDMPLITSLEGAGSIDEFVNIYLENNDALINLNELNANLNIVGGILQSPSLFISGNANLSDISRLDTAQWNSSLTGEITDNAQLAVCENSLVCDRIDNNSIIITNNALGCNSVSEVDMACEGLSVDEFDEDIIKIYPNPISDFVSINGLRTDELISVRIFSTSGQKLVESKKLGFDISDFNSGLYFIEINTNNGRFVKPILKE